jgi:hypothetical protein
MASEAPSALSRSAFSAVEVVAITRAPKTWANLQRKDRNTPGTLDQDGVSRGDPTMARQRDPGGHRGAWQGGSFLEGQVAWQKHDCFFIEDRVFCQHAVEIGAEPVGQVVRLDRSAKPARVKATGNPVANFDPSNSFANCCDLAGAVGQRHYAEFRRTATVVQTQ